MSDYLPEEVILKILHKLPIKSIVQCTCVCKSWLSLIKNPSFISTHLSHTITSTKSPLLLFRYCTNPEDETLSYKEHYSLRFDNNKEINHHINLHFPFKGSNPYFRIIGSCNGLICLSDDLYCYSNIIILWNPSIGKYLKLPIVTFCPHGPYTAFIGFGFDSRSDDYKVVRMAAPQVDIFSLKANSWKSITDIAPKYRVFGCGSQAFVNGVVHWVAFRHRKDDNVSSNVVLALDMGYDVFHEIMLPNCLAQVYPMHLYISVYGESSIAVSHRDILNSPFQCHIWVMKEYGVVGSWTKLFILGQQGESLPMPLGFRKNGEVLFEMNTGRIASCDPESQHIRNLGIQEEMLRTFVDTYVESLVLLDKKNVSSYVACDSIDASRLCSRQYK